MIVFFNAKRVMELFLDTRTSALRGGERLGRVKARTFEAKTPKSIAREKGGLGKSAGYSKPQHFYTRSHV